MEKLDPREVARLLSPYLQAPAPEELCAQIVRYLELLAVWNSKVSLTSVREPAEVVQRHFGEGLFLAERLPTFRTLLDLGSGAGFPGIPIALHGTQGQITLGESQKKKAAFLREAVWTLGLPVTVWADRVEQMPVSERFNVVTLRAVDDMERALLAAVDRVTPDGTVVFFAGEGTPFPLQVGRWGIEEHPIPLSAGKLVLAKWA